MWDVAVIGAGLSGIVCARRLVSAGYSVCILDKSRGVGGRMATRRVGDRIRVDHGLRYWQPKSEELRSLTADLLSAGVLKPWTASEYEIHEPGKLTQVEASAPKYVTQTGMSAIAKYLLAHPQDHAQGRQTTEQTAEPPAFERGKTLLTEHRAVSIHPREGGWRIACETGEVVMAKRCAIAIPAEQAATLLTSSLSTSGLADGPTPDHPTSDYPTSDLRRSLAEGIEALKAVSYFPSLTVLAGYDETYRTQMNDLDPQGWMVSDYAGTSTDWVGLDSSKCSRTSTPVVVIHSRPEFAQRYLDTHDLQPAASVLLRANARRLLDWIAQPEWFQIQRWRYAQVRSPHPQASLAISDTLVCGGDWCIDSSADTTLESIDYAYLSGRSLADHLQH